ncbi:MAG: TetR/AcrR family transcriptional regulator [Limnochordaceae bacterium]|nr:TetR/AcrR family transcriptional regulator [Limnochordaceae bacterium]
MPPAMSSRHNGEATRRRLIDAAIRVIARKGYHQATVDEIVAECGSSKGAFYFHFESKDALFVNLLEEFAGRLASAVEQAVRSSPVPGAGRVEAAVKAALELFAAHEELARVFLVEAVGVSPELEARRRALVDRFTTLIQLYLEQAARRHPLAVVDTRVAASAALGAINEVVVQWLSAPAAGRSPSLRPSSHASSCGAWDGPKNPFP